jgi:phenylacetate-CoA ligase
MSVYTAIASGLIFPLHERLKGHSSVRRRKELELSQWHSPEQIAGEQLHKLNAFLQDIGTHVPYYHKLFQEAGFVPGQLESISGLAQLPLLGKPEIRAAGADMKSEKAGELRRYNTGGSSGEPLVFYIGADRVSHDVAAKWRATRWWDVDIGDPEMVIWGSPIEVGSQDRIRQLRDSLLRSYLLPAFEMSRPNLDHFIAEIQRIKPKMLFGYPSALSVIAEHAKSTGMDVAHLGIKVTFVTSERLYDHQRELIETVFGCPVANGYGGRDAGFIAHQCPEGGMHISAEDIIVEIVDPQGSVLPAGQSGEIVVTHMATGDFPFLRYRTGDMGVLGHNICACGRGLPLLEEIQGRTTDFVIARDGTVIHGLALIYVLRDLPGIASFKITQHTVDRTTVQIVRADGYVAENEAEIVKTFTGRLGEGVDIDIQYADTLESERSGKFRFVVSHVAR